MKSFRFSMLTLTLLSLLLASGIERGFAQATSPDDEDDFITDTGPANGGPGVGNEDSQHVPGLRIGEPRAGGTGCPDGSTMVALTPDQKALSILFSHFNVEAGGSDSAHDTKQCDLEIPIEVPQGFHLQVVKMDYRGFVSLPTESRGMLHSLSFFSDPTTGTPIARRFLRRKRFAGPITTNFAVTSRTRAGRGLTECGRSVKLNIQSRLVIQNRAENTNEITTMNLDSLDTSENRIIYHLRWRACRGERRRR